MPRRITFTEAEALLRSREQLLAAGMSERHLASHVAAGRYLRLHRGWYVDAEDWNSVWSEDRQLLRVIALARSTPGPGPIFVRESAGVLWDLPLYRHGTELVHTLITGRRHSRTVAGVARHDVGVADADIVERHGLLCTSLTRTVFDMSRTMSLEAAVSGADAALARVAVDNHRQDPDAAAEWRDGLVRLAKTGLRGVRQARGVTEFADGRSQLPGESVSRLQLYRLGYDRVDLQVPVVGAAGDQYFLDFGFLGARRFGEFDGDGKYFDADLRTAATPRDALLTEKRREDDIRGVTGWGLARWGRGHIATPDALGARLVAFGIRPPG